MQINISKVNLKEAIKEHREFLFILAIFWGIIIFTLLYTISATNWHIVYSLDDTYIHMAIAKNFSQKGVWGITDKEFSSSSSSLLYTLLLSLFFLFGPHEITPLIINLVFTTLLLFVIYYILKIKHNLPTYAVLIGLTLIFFFLPIPYLIIIGMEHIIQIFINVIFVFLASNILSDENLQERKIFLKQKEDKSIFINDKLYLLVIPTVTMIRFEGMFLIIIVSSLFIVRKKIFYSLLTLTLGFLPIIIFGLISVLNGWYFFPNSVMLKGNFLNLSSIDNIIDFFDLRIIIKNPHLFILIIGALLIFSFSYFKRKKVWEETSIMAMILICTTFFQIFFGGVALDHPNFSRYDAYLIALGIILFFISIKNQLPQKFSIEYVKIYFSEFKEYPKINKIYIITTVLVLIIFFPSLFSRSYNLTREAPQASKNIYEQQYQMGLFLNKYYDGEVIAASDIGAIGYLADVEIIDLRGLGSLSVARHRLNDNFDTEDVKKMTERRDCKIAIIYEDKDYGYDVPSNWKKAGEWTIKNNVVAGDDTVSFWAVDPDEWDDLIDHLKDFSSHLPYTVTESGNYTK